MDQNQDKPAATNILINRYSIGSTTLFIDQHRTVRSVHKLPIPLADATDQRLVVQTLYRGQDTEAAKLAMSVARMCGAPRYEWPQSVSQLKIAFGPGGKDIRIVDLAQIEDQWSGQTVTGCRIYARAKTVNLKHLFQLARLFAFNCEPTATGQRWHSPSGWHIDVQNDHGQGTSTWSALITGSRLRFEHKHLVQGWLQFRHRPDLIMRFLWNRMFGHMYAVLGSECWCRSEAYTEYKKGAVYGRDFKVRLLAARNQNWNPLVPYKRWQKACELGKPRIEWIEPEPEMVPASTVNKSTSSGRQRTTKRKT